MKILGSLYLSQTILGLGHAKTLKYVMIAALVGWSQAYIACLPQPLNSARGTDSEQGSSVCLPNYICAQDDLPAWLSMECREKFGRLDHGLSLKQFVLQSPLVVQAAGGTKKVQKTQKKVQSAGKNVLKGAKRNLPGKPGKALKKGAGGGGADAWYGPDRALFLGELLLQALRHVLLEQAGPMQI